MPRATKHTSRTAKTQPTVDQTMVLELITAAWQLYRQQGWANRPNRNVVMDPIVALDTVDEHSACAGDVMVPSLYDTVLQNVMCRLHADHAAPQLLLDISHSVRDAAAADRTALIMDHVMRQLQDDHNEFRAKIAGLLHEPHVRYQDIKILCYFTTMADAIRSRQQCDLVVDAARNATLAPVNHTVDVTVQILSVRYNQNFSTHDHKAITEDGCLVSFFQKTRLAAESHVHIVGRVKAHGTSYRRPDLAETRLIQVKIINDLKGQTAA